MVNEEIKFVILKTVELINGKYGVSFAIAFLRQSKSQKIIKSNLIDTNYYGCLRSLPASTLQHHIDYLIENGYIIKSADTYPVILLSQKGVAFICENAQLEEQYFNKNSSYQYNLPSEVIISYLVSSILDNESIKVLHSFLYGLKSKYSNHKLFGTFKNMSTHECYEYIYKCKIDGYIDQERDYKYLHITDKGKELLDDFSEYLIDLDTAKRKSSTINQAKKHKTYSGVLYRCLLKKHRRRYAAIQNALRDASSIDDNSYYSSNDELFKEGFQLYKENLKTLFDNTSSSAVLIQKYSNPHLLVNYVAKYHNLIKHIIHAKDKTKFAKDYEYDANPESHFYIYKSLIALYAAIIHVKSNSTIDYGQKVLNEWISIIEYGTPERKKLT